MEAKFGKKTKKRKEEEKEKAEQGVKEEPIDRKAELLRSWKIDEAKTPAEKRKEREEKKAKKPPIKRKCIGGFGTSVW